MKRGMFRRITAFVLALAMVISLMPTTVYADGTRTADKSTVTASKDGITVTKHAEYTQVDGKYVDANGNPYIKITFTVSADEMETETREEISADTDIVLVIDNSTSMGSRKTSNSKLNKAISAAKEFVKDLYALPGGKIKIGIVYFDEDVVTSEKLDLTEKGTQTTIDDNHKVIKTIDAIQKGSGTNIQAGIYHGQDILSKGNAQNKIMVVLSDGEPHESYKRTKLNSSYTITTSKKTANRKIEYSYNETKVVDGSGGYSEQKNAAIDQAYLAREQFKKDSKDNLSIYTIGYDIANSISAQNTLKSIADDGAYYSSGEDALEGVFGEIVTSVEQKINSVKLSDMIPSDMENSSEFAYDSITSGKVTNAVDAESGDVTFTWGESLEKQTYTMSFVTTLDLSKLNAQSFLNNPYFNTNGDEVTVGGTGSDSSILTYGKDGVIKLDSPQLQMDSSKYEVHYFYDGVEDKGQEVKTTYVWNVPNVADPTYTVVDKNDDKDTYELDKVEINGNDGDFGLLTINEDKVVNVYYKKIQKKDVIIKKVWDDNKNQDGKRTAVTAVLKDSEGNFAKNFKGQVIGENIVLNKDNDWTVRLTDLRASEVYSVLEMTSVEGYSKSDVTTSTKTENGKEVVTYTITNTHTPETCNVNVVVEWKDDSDRDGLRPDNVAIKLYKTVDGDKELVDTDNTLTSTTFENLPVYEDGKKISYSVVQEGVPSEYSTTPDHKDTGLDFKFINEYTPKTTSVKVKKNWIDGNNAEDSRTAITVQLLKNGTPLTGKTVTLTESNRYEATFVGLHLNEGGVPINYTIQEVSVPNGYVPTYSQDGLTVTNTYKQKEKTSVTVNKNWDDASDVDGLRPSKINVTLKATVSEGADAIADISADILATDNWSYTFENLKAYDSNGAKVIYKVVENTRISGYETTYEGNGTGTVTITNSHTPKTTDVVVKKVWDGDSHVASIVRPNEVTLKLYANGEPVKDGEVNLSGNDNNRIWEYTFKDLPENDIINGKSTPINYTVEEITTLENYSKKADGLTVTNTYNPIMITHTVDKVWDDNNDHDGMRPEEISVTLYGKTDSKDEYTVETVSFGADDKGEWNYTFEELPLYNDEGEKITYYAKEERVAGYDAPAYDEDKTDRVTTITNSRDNEVKNFTVEKIWNDDDDRDGLRPTSIKVKLLCNSDLVEEVILNADNEWTYTWKGLEVYGPSATSGVITNNYTVEEVLEAKDMKNYSTSEPTYNADKTEATITNTHKVKTTSLVVNKEWNDNYNQDGKRADSVTVRLFANGVAVPVKDGGVVELNESNLWSYEWKNLYVNEDGKKITYTVKEDSVANYTSNIKEANGLVFTNGVANVVNTHAPEKIEILVKKVWDDDDNVAKERDKEVTINVMNDKEVAATVTLNDDNEWQDTVTVDKYADGNLIEYSLEETYVKSGYTVSYSDSVNGEDEELTLTVTNTYNVEIADFTVTKVWEDNNDQDGYRPEEIEVQLYANGEAVSEEDGGVVVLNESNEWIYTWTGLEVERDGEAITYSVQEITKLDEYDSDAFDSPVDFNENNEAVITNTHETEETTHTVKKIWQDFDDNDGYRPSSIEVQLYGRHDDDEVPEAYGEVVVLEAPESGDTNEWTYTWENLDKYKDGKEIEYYVEELVIYDGYEEVEYDYTSEAKVSKITNKHSKDQITLTIEKNWVGDEAVVSKRPDSITVDLLANGEVINTVALTEGANGKWSTTKDVDRYASQEEIEYSIVNERFFYGDEEKSTSGYSVSYSEAVKDVDSTLTVTNTYNVKTANFTVNKNWIDANNQDGYRPSSVSVQLYKDGVGYGLPVVLNESNDWTYTWPDLEIARDGDTFTYTVQEVDVPDGYTSNALDEIEFEMRNESNYAITINNTHTIETTPFTVVKVWEDLENNDGYRTDSVVVQLYANGEAVSKEDGGIVELNKSTGWTYTWNSLDKKANGSDIKYTVLEVEVPDGYRSIVTELEDTIGQKITNKHDKDQITLTIEKDWVGDEAVAEERPDSVTVDLYADGSKIDTITLTRDDDWTAEVVVDRYASTKVIEYSVKEVTFVSGYTASYSNPVKDVNSTLTVTNTYNVETANFTVVKNWNDNDNQDGYRPSSVTVQLYKNNEPEGMPVELNDETEWVYTWVGLETTRDGLNNYYSVREIVAEDSDNAGYYVSNATDNAIRFIENDDNNYSITVVNTHEVEKTEHTVKKVWDDEKNNDRIRPESIEVELYADGEATGKTLILSEENNWEGKWTDLDNKAAGEDIIYTVKENTELKDYEVSYSTEDTVTTITNTHEIYKKDVTVLFNWDDINDIEGVRTDKMVANLYKVVSGDINSVLGSKDETTEEPSDEDEEIVDADTGLIIGYLLSDDDLGGAIDEDATDEIVKELVDSKEVTKDTWYESFTDLPVYEDGKEVVYLVLQDALPNAGTKEEYTYISTVNNSEEADFVITNKYRATINKDITIVWDDENNNSNIRPDEVIVQPTVDGEDYGNPVKITVEDTTDDDSNKWIGNTSELPKYTEDGKEITYRVVQSDVVSYETTYSDDSFTITNKYRRPLGPEDEDPEIIEEPEDDKKLSTPAKEKDTKKKDTKKTDETPDTSDAYDISRYIWMLVLSAMGILVMLKSKKEEA